MSIYPRKRLTVVHDHFCLYFTLVLGTALEEKMFQSAPAYTSPTRATAPSMVLRLSLLRNC